MRSLLELSAVLLVAGCNCCSKKVPHDERARIPEQKTFLTNYTNLPGMGQETKTDQMFSLDLGRTFDESSIVQMMVWTDTEGLNWDPQTCNNDKLTEWCRDYISIANVLTNEVDAKVTAKDATDRGEQIYIEKVGRNSDHFPAAAKQFATGKVSVSVSPSQSDNYTVHRILVTVGYNESQ